MAVSSKHHGWSRIRDSSTSQVGVYSAGQKRFEIGSTALTTEGANTAALLHGVGTTTTPAKTSTANKNFLGYWVESSATSGDARGIYTRLYISGAAGAGEAGRFYTTVSDVAADTVRGAHISLDFASTGSVTGLGAALEATLHINNSGSAAGTMYGVKSAINSDGATSDPAGATTLAYFAAVNQGNATGAADVDTDAVLFDVTGHATGTGTLFQTVTTAYTLGEITNSLKIKVGGTIYHILLSTTGAQAT